MSLGMPELLIILVIVIVIFGPGRFGKIFGELGSGIKSFKDNLGIGKDEQADKAPDEKKE